MRCDAVRTNVPSRSRVVSPRPCPARADQAWRNAGSRIASATIDPDAGGAGVSKPRRTAKQRRATQARRPAANDERPRPRHCAWRLYGRWREAATPSARYSPANWRYLPSPPPASAACRGAWPTRASRPALARPTARRRLRDSRHPGSAPAGHAPSPDHHPRRARRHAPWSRRRGRRRPVPGGRRRLRFPSLRASRDGSTAHAAMSSRSR